MLTNIAEKVNYYLDGNGRYHPGLSEIRRMIVQDKFKIRRVGVPNWVTNEEIKRFREDSRQQHCDKFIEKILR